MGIMMGIGGSALGLHPVPALPDSEPETGAPAGGSELPSLRLTSLRRRTVTSRWTSRVRRAHLMLRFKFLAPKLNAARRDSGSSSDPHSSGGDVECG
jgi:hypothetical protein